MGDNKKIVPPSFILGITFGGFIFSFVKPETFSNVLLELLMLGIYVYMAGMVQDRIMITLLGYSGKIAMNKKSILAYVPLDILQDKIATSSIITNLGLQTKPKEITKGLRYQSESNSIYTTVIDIKQIDINDDHESCSINIIVFKKGRYEITSDCTDYLNGQLDVIYGFLTRNKIKTEDNKHLSDINQTVSDISSKLNGVSHHIGKVTSFGWIRVFAFLAVLGSVGYLFQIRGSTEGVIGTFVMFLLYIVFETHGFREQPR